MPDGIDQEALTALTRSMLDNTPRPMLGTKSKPGILIGKGKAQKDAAVFLEANGLVEKTDLVEGKARQPLYRISAKGISFAMENAEPVQLLREIKDSVNRLLGLRDRIEATLKGVDQQQKMLDILSHRLKSPATQPVATNLPERQSEWLNAVLKFIADYQRENPNQFCPLPIIYRSIAKPAGASTGLFQDGIRRLASEGRLRLHPYTLPLHTIEGEECALVADREIKYYAQYTDGHAAS